MAEGVALGDDEPAPPVDDDACEPASEIVEGREATLPVATEEGLAGGPQAAGSGPDLTVEEE